jgi:predicted nucleic acid-binding protein
VRTAWVCLDSAFILQIFLGPRQDEAWEKFQEWIEEGREVAVPPFLTFEVANVLYRYMRRRILKYWVAADVLQAVEMLPLLVRFEPELHYEAMALAEATPPLSVEAAHYLVLAEKLDAELWTGDPRLAQTCDRAGLRVCTVGERSLRTPAERGLSA